MNMARPRLISEETIVSYAKSYIEEVCKGNLNNFTYVQLAEYMNSAGEFNVKEHQIRRCKALSEYLTSFKKSFLENKHEKILMFENLNVDDFIRKNNTSAKLKNALVQRDQYYKELYDYLQEVLKENKSLTEKMQLLSTSFSKLQETSSEQLLSVQLGTDKTKQLEEKVRTLTNIVHTYVYPEIANKLLEESGFIKTSQNPISTDGMEQVIRTKDNIINGDSLEPSNKIRSNNLIQNLFDSI